MIRYFMVVLSFLYTTSTLAEAIPVTEQIDSQAGTLAISVAFDSAGNLWRASIKNRFLLVDKSIDLGKTFSAPIKVHPLPQMINAEGEARPKIAIDLSDNIYLTWTEALKKPVAGYLWFARSIDAGKTFEKPYIVHEYKTEIARDFDSLNVTPEGNITVTWVDQRDFIAAEAAGKKYLGAAIYYMVSQDKGASFKHEQKLADNNCECCEIVTTNKPDGTVVALWRHRFEGSEQGHMLAEIAKDGLKSEPHRATFGRGMADPCPSFMPAAIASGGEGANWWGYHMAYFDGKDTQVKSGPGLYYSRMDGVAWVSSPPKKFGDYTKQANHPALLSMGEKSEKEQVWLVWREVNDGKPSIMGMVSDDGGKSWNQEKLLLTTHQKDDYPILLQYKHQAYLVWNTQYEGLRMIELKP